MSTDVGILVGFYNYKVKCHQKHLKNQFSPLSSSTVKSYELQITPSPIKILYSQVIHIIIN